MKSRRNYLWRITGILALILIYGMISVSAIETPDLTGNWTLVAFEKYTPDEGFGTQNPYPTSYEFTSQDRRALIGVQKFFRTTTNENITELFSGALSPDGRTFEIDNEGSGISFGEIVSDTELYIYTLLPDKGPKVLSFHLVKEDTKPSSSETVPELTGIWNLTHNRNNADSTTGILTVEQQQDRIWVGTEQVLDEDGITINQKITGTIGEEGRIYAASSDGAFMFGSIAGNDSIESVFIIPGDDDGTYVVDRELTKNEVSKSESKIDYPIITGDWKIDNRKIIHDGYITDGGTLTDEWLSFSNQTGKFFTAVRYNQTAGTVSEGEGSGIFRTPDEAFVTGADSSIEIYHIIDNSTIEAIVNKKDNHALLYLDVLTRKAG